jgi:VCBS repeat-containing protein
MEAQMRPIRLVIADRRPIVLQGFASLFAAERDFEIVASCLDGTGCLQAVRKLSPDVALVEDGFSDVTASEMLAAVEELPTRLVFYTASIARGDLAAAIVTGACSAIPMSERPENLLQSLRLVAPASCKAAAGMRVNGAFSEERLEALTDQERKIMRLIACGMSNKEIASQLNVHTGAIRSHIDRISTQLKIKNRAELAAVALSRLSSGIGAIAALIFAALDEARAANTTAASDMPTDTFTVMAADGNAEVVTIKINPKKTDGASGKAAKALIKAGRVENAASDIPARTGKLVGTSPDLAASAMALAALNPPRPGLSSTFMIAAAGIWIYELLNSRAHAFAVGDGLTDVVASEPADGTRELGALNIPGIAGAKLDGFENLAWLSPEVYHQPFVFHAPCSDAVARIGDEVQITDATAGNDSGGGDVDPRAWSIAIEASIGHGGFENATTVNASSNDEHHTIQATAGDESHRGQSQRDLHAAEGGGAAGERLAEHGPPGNNANHGQSQRELPASENGPAAGKQHDKHDPSGNDSSHGQSRELHALEDGAATGKQHVKHDSPGNNSSHWQSQRDLHGSNDGTTDAGQHVKEDTRPGGDANYGQPSHDLQGAPVYASRSAHVGSSQKAGGKDHAIDDSGQAHTAAVPELGDSFNFKNEMAVTKASDRFERYGGHGPHSIEHAEQEGLAPIQNAELIGPSHAEHSAVEYAKGAAHHLTHDLFV